MIKPNKNPHNVTFDQSTDVTIVGGGLVGLAAALALSQIGLKIILLESFEVKNNSHPSYDDRTLVVNNASVCFWKNLNIWKNLSENITVINKVHVSNKGHFGNVIFNAKEFDSEALAYIVEAKELGFKLLEKVKEDNNIQLICPAQVIKFTPTDKVINICYQVALQDEIQTYSICSKLMLAADGAQSSIRSQLKLETQVQSYDKTAIICNITPELKHNNCAYERLTSSGPTALLPFVNNRCGFVWTVDKQKAKEIINLPDNEFLRQAQTQFGYRLGRFLKVGQRTSYPLYLIKVPKQVKSRIILLGNAAHTMSPVSAQGLNLAIRDVAMLVEVINQSLGNKNDIGSDQVLNIYQSKIKQDQDQTMRYTDDLMTWFQIDHTMVSNLRSVGLLALDQMVFMKSNLYNRVSGYRGNTPKLLRYI